ncbi:putative GTP-pyrophosphokinase [Secundilactobacillus oryzae JCM 18671]|uniref:Putative GTP-pyrophosphokinase n=1 Tax=Secundilactobacillus oryzae JCM 18671 TaxID=1291743 RepID=A0A081BJQ9_9LACO|nr:putative GTP-pyrophosphokinase [Secundilactobacillus oryzae JCM 18671]
MEERIKSVQSIMKKLQKKGFEPRVANMKTQISDVAGIRVITNYIDDIYLIEKLLVNQSDVTLLKRKDYVKDPKPSGYRSVHLVASVPVFQASGVQDVKVEIQIRTIGMDMWASLEHKLRYKTDIDEKLVDQYGADLHCYSDELAEIEAKMQTIYQKLNDDSEIKQP